VFAQRVRYIVNFTVRTPYLQIRLSTLKPQAVTLPGSLWYDLITSPSVPSSVDFLPNGTSLYILLANKFHAMPDEQNNNPGNVPHGSETFGTVPNDSAPFRNVPKISERTENHILTVRDVARMFESAGVARTERSIVNWCQFNSAGIARLDAYLDPNEGKYFITPQSAEAAIKEEQAKFAKQGTPSETFGTVPKAVQHQPSNTESADEESSRIKELEKRMFDLQVLNAGKDFYIEKLQGERTAYVNDLMLKSHRIGELETRLVQLDAPNDESNRVIKLRVVSNGDQSPSENQ